MQYQPLYYLHDADISHSEKSASMPQSVSTYKLCAEKEVRSLLINFAGGRLRTIHIVLPEKWSRYFWRYIQRTIYIISLVNARGADVRVPNEKLFDEFTIVHMHCLMETPFLICDILWTNNMRLISTKISRLIQVQE